MLDNLIDDRLSNFILTRYLNNKKKKATSESQESGKDRNIPL